jgi:hypothetical protein
MQDPGVTEVIRLQHEDSLKLGCAWDVFYFRSSKYWTKELEKELINRHRENRVPVDLSKFGAAKL